jgi:Fe-S oxidoreductase/nitrate reductase gamma subunit
MDAQPVSLLTREVFGNVSTLSKVLFYCLAMASMGVLAWGIWLRVRRWRIGKPNAEHPDWRRMLRNLWRYALLQRRVRGRGAASAAHLLLYGGFGLLFLGTTLIGIEHLLASMLGRGGQDPVFHKGLYFVIYEPVLELAGLALLAGCGFFAYRRWKQPPELGHDARDWLVLALFATIGVTGFLLEGFRIILEDTPWPWLSFVGALTASGFKGIGLTASGAATWHVAMWWLHALLVFAFIALLPYTRLLHLIAGTVRLAAGVERLGSLPRVSIAEVEETGEIGVARVEQFTRRRLVELDACVSCGRCDQACPALEAGKPLSPRTVVQDIRGQLDIVAIQPAYRTNAASSPPLVGEIIRPETVWSCTACSACVDVCPLGVSPLGFIIELRRSLVADAQLRGPPAQALQKTDRTGNPWGLPARDRMAWAADLDVPTVQDNPGFEVLYWIGCAAAYDRRLQKVARSIVKLFRAADVNFAVIGNLEHCTGEAARRMGDELLFQQLAGKNLETFDRIGVQQRGKRIVSHCPHCVNTFQQDYPQLGANLDVVHHTEFLDALVRRGLLPKPTDTPGGASATGSGGVTYHDPCYLARVRDVTTAPRNLLDFAERGSLVEMPRHGRKTACCGAGGGRMWFDDTADRRVGQSRVDEALATKAGTLAVSCPFCLTMTADGLAARGSTMVVRDIAEILADALPLEKNTTQKNQTSDGL